MDTVLAINSAILTYLLADETLATTMGNTNISVGENYRSSDFPYMSWSIKNYVDPLSPVVMSGILTMHLWDKGALTSTIYEMRGRLIKLLDREVFQLTGGEAKAVRVFYDSDLIVPEEVEFIHHFVILYTVKYIRSGDLNIE